MEQRESHGVQSVGEGTAHSNVIVPKVPETTHAPTFLSRASSMTAREPVVRTLHTSLWPLVVFIFYATLSAFTWVVFCIASNRPFGTNQDWMTQEHYRHELDAVLTKHENALRAAQILQAVVALLTIPITSAICSMALVVFIQTSGARTRLNLRQTMALADQGWISPRIWILWSKVGSLPLYVAFGLTLCGAIFQILQQTFVQVTTTQMASWATSSRTDFVPDLPELINRGNVNRNSLVVRLRSILESTRDDQHEPFLWLERQVDPGCPTDSALCTYPDYRGSLEKIYDSDRDVDVWFTPLVSNFNTGVYDEPQYAPRINTTITYENMTATEWPSECVRDREGVFFAEYHGRADYYDADLTACMPTNISDTPWQATHNRQDITEELYLNVSEPSGETTSYYKVTAKSSLGYFELPGVNNGDRAGPLLDNCSLSSLDTWGSKGDSSWSKDLVARDTNISYAGNTTQAIGNHIGPLTALGLALFGEGSFIEKRISNPSAFVTNRTLVFDPDSETWYTPSSVNCVSSMPLGYAMSDEWECTRDYDHRDENKIILNVLDWISSFTRETSARKAFAVGAFLANKEWLDQARGYGYDYQRKRSVAVDPGIAITKTTMTMVEIIISSIFLGAYLLGLLALAIYAVYGKPFMPWLGAEIMIKAGMTHAEILSAAEGDKQWKHTIAACPGFVGDEKPEDNVGRIAFGAAATLSRSQGRQFEAL